MPALGVIVAVIEDGKILLTKREDFEVWCLPGGRVEEGESLAEGAIREAREETGLEVELTRLVGVYSRIGGGMHDIHVVLYTATPVRGQIRTQPHETIEVAYFPFDQIPTELLFGHKKRILDAIQNASGVSVRQEVEIIDKNMYTREEIYDARDRSGLSRQEFYLPMAALMGTLPIAIGFGAGGDARRPWASPWWAGCSPPRCSPSTSPR